MMYDTESGIIMKSEDFTDQVDISNKFYTDTPNTSMIDNKKSRRNSYVNIDTKNNFLSQKRENEESQLSKRSSLKPQIIIENGVMRVERPNFIEIYKKVNEEIRQGNERNAISVDMTGERNKLSSMSFKKNVHTDKWSIVETEFFYKSLEYFGTDFSILEIILKPRIRSQIKNKFHKEEKINSSRVEISLKNFKPENTMKFLFFMKSLRKQNKTYENVDFKKLINEDFLSENLNFKGDNSEDSVIQDEEEEENNSEEDENNTISDQASSKEKTEKNIKP